MRIKKKLSAAKGAVDCFTNSPCQQLRECMGNSKENICISTTLASFSKKGNID